MKLNIIIRRFYSTVIDTTVKSRFELPHGGQRRPIGPLTDLIKVTNISRNMPSLGLNYSDLSVSRLRKDESDVKPVVGCTNRYWTNPY